jgi:hypothetical protein
MFSKVMFIQNNGDAVVHPGPPPPLKTLDAAEEDDFY